MKSKSAFGTYLVKDQINVFLFSEAPWELHPADTTSRFEQWETHERSIGDPRETHERLMGDQWEGHGRPMGAHGLPIGDP